MPIDRHLVDPEPGYVRCHYRVAISQWTVAELRAALDEAKREGVPDRAFVSWGMMRVEFSWSEL